VTAAGDGIDTAMLNIGRGRELMKRFTGLLAAVCCLVAIDSNAHACETTLNKTIFGIVASNGPIPISSGPLTFSDYAFSATWDFGPLAPYPSHSR